MPNYGRAWGMIEATSIHNCLRVGAHGRGRPGRNSDIEPTVALRIPRKLDATEAFVRAITGRWSLQSWRSPDKDRTGYSRMSKAAAWLGSS
jgi:hypothetical protein